jgi:hypothetical protein
MAEQNKDSSDNIMWIMGALVVLFLVFQHFFGNTIKEAYLTLKLVQLKIISLVYQTEFAAEAIYFIEHTSPSQVTPKEAMFIGGRVGWIINIPMIAFLGYWGIKVWNKNPLQKFKRVLSMQTLKESEQRLWPYIAPMVNVNLMKESFFTGPYAMAMKPYDFSIKYHLLQEEKNVDSLDRKKAEKLFISQLGKPFSEFSRLRKHEQALLAIFAAN